MKPTSKVCSLLALTVTLFIGISAKSASFQNLNFENSPSLPPGDYSYPFTLYANALPGWTVHVDGTVQAGAFANEFLLDAPGVALMTDGANPLDGSKSVYLQSTYNAPIGMPGARPINVSISQVGLVPAESLSLRFMPLNQWYEFYPQAPGPFEVLLGGNNLSLVPMVSNLGYVEYGADISAWAGQNLELSIKVLTSPTPGLNTFPEGWAYVDSITFSPTAIPEPSLVALVTMGGCVLIRVISQRRSRE